jgi:hypothetical protein
VAGRRSGRGHCRAARLGLQFFHLPQGAVAIEAIGGLALGSTGGWSPWPQHRSKRTRQSAGYSSGHTRQ